jgi:hypothetical protein
MFYCLSQNGGNNCSVKIKIGLPSHKQMFISFHSQHVLLQTGHQVIREEFTNVNQMDIKATVML